MIEPGWERVAAYNAFLLLGVLPYALARGGRPEQLCALVLSAGSLLTLVALHVWPIRSVEPARSVLVIDLAGTLCFVSIAIAANRRWTVHLAAIQSLSVVVHAVRWTDPGILRWVYKLFIFAPSWAMLALIAVGTWRHRSRLRHRGADASWRSFSARPATVDRTSSQKLS